ncbi:MAG: HNH endonuclease signature motif containing protein [Fimbriimonadaceae bacterium]
MLRPGDILSHHEMCAIEGRGLQQGMSFRTQKLHSIILMSQRKGAPYPDRMSADGKVLTYIGHDAYGVPDKDRLDQPLATDKGTLTQNGLFFKAATFKESVMGHELVRVYEKLHMGVWVFNGLFRLVDARMESDGLRNVCVFELHLIENETELEEREVAAEIDQLSLSPGRLIPSNVKLAVFKRDKGQCVLCGSKQNLHFDHILPWSKGGSSTTAENVQLLCQKHNLEKSAKIG